MGTPPPTLSGCMSRVNLSLETNGELLDSRRLRLARCHKLRATASVIGSATPSTIASATAMWAKVSGRADKAIWIRIRIRIPTAHILWQLRGWRAT